MSWPDDQAYNEAVQDPRVCFADAELRTGTVATLPTGLPKVVSGSFASVYQIKCPRREWAVRCFRKEISDQEFRYGSISRHLQSTNLPYFVRFEFLREGIRVGPRWYPTVKMEWVQGQRLDQFIRENLERPDVLRRLAREWSEMMQALQRAQIAHGDLQNGNVLVVNGALKLIDYDGMYVPALAGRPSTERGHPDFQHPARSSADFGPLLDRFSAWVVYSSLVALSIDRGLWGKLGGCEDRLLLRAADFADPGASYGFRALRRSGAPELAGLARKMTACLRGSPREVRPLNARHRPRTERRQDVRGSEWWRGQVPPRPRTRAHAVPVAALGAKQRGMEWLKDHLAQSKSRRTVSSAGWSLVKRLYALAAVLIAAASAFAALVGTRVLRR
jgi:hypothetical protein